jgi:3-hydroxyacyl-CoA dehydrogenase
MRVSKVGVVGAGAMGSGIAALAASAGVPVVLLDIPTPGTQPGDPTRSDIARTGLDKAVKAKMAAFMDTDRAKLVRTGNTEDDLELLADCDWIVEAIIEQPAPKQALYARLEPLLKEGAVVSSNTSGIPMHVLVEGRGETFKKNFVGAHFFNPPRYMHLLELIPTPDTSPAALGAVRHFAERVLGKGVVIARDAPGFVANRLGVFGMVQAMRLMEEFGLSIDEVDAATGPLIGRAKSATFRTGDLSGIDVLVHVTEGLSQTTGQDLRMPAWVKTQLVDQKRFGDKTGSGFYKKVGKDIQTLDWKTGEYGPQTKVESPELTAALKKQPAERAAAIKTLPGASGDFVRKFVLVSSHYALTEAEQIAYDVPAIDRAMEWGYGAELGPFRLMDALGLDWIRDGFKSSGMDEPELLKRAKGAFYNASGEREQVIRFEGAYAPVAEVPGRIALASLKAAGKVLESSRDAAILDLGDGVALLQFTSKMNTLGEGVLRMLDSAMTRVSRDGLEGLVIGNDDPRTFAAGADLMGIGMLAQQGDWKALDGAIRAFQNATTSLGRAPFPVVVAPFGLTLGGGAEMTLHASAVQAHAELYMGLVEVGVGVIPAGGGTKELLFRFTKELERYDEADPFEAVKRAFNLIALAQTSSSALDAKRQGYLERSTRISMNRDTLLADAKARVLDLASDWVPAPPRTIRAMGREALGNLEYGLFSFRESGKATDHDVVIGKALAYVLCGGDGPPREVTEQDILDLEREAFLELLGTKPTQQRIEAMLKTGKPLRN